MAVTSLAEIAVRTTQVWGGLRTRPYSMGGTVPRNDCSSFVAEVLGLPNPLAWSTVNLPQVLTPISFDQALPGDVWGKLGPGTSGAAGHVAVITGTPRTRGDTRWEVVEQSGPTGVKGPARNVYKNPPAGYRAYRSKYVATVLPMPPTTVEDDDMWIIWAAGSGYLAPGDMVDSRPVAIPQSRANLAKLQSMAACGVRQVTSAVHPKAPEWFVTAVDAAWPPPVPPVEVELSDEDIAELAAQMAELQPDPLTHEQTVEATRQGAELAEDS